MTHVDLFSGIGGFSIAAERHGFRTIAFCERDPYATAVLRRHWPGIPIHDDITTADFSAYAGATLVTGGFPCQPFSVAGLKRGKEDDRFLWPAMLRAIQAIQPAWVIGENVAGIIPMELDRVLSDLEGIGYTALPFIIPACAVDSLHRRDRVWIVANASGGRFGESEGWKVQQPRGTEALGGSKDVAHPQIRGVRRRETQRESGQLAGDGEAVSDTNNTGRIEQRRTEPGKPQFPPPEQHCRWEPEPGLGRMAHGIPNRVDRLRCLGNAIVPQVAEEIIRAIVMQMEGKP